MSLFCFWLKPSVRDIDGPGWTYSILVTNISLSDNNGINWNDEGR